MLKKMFCLAMFMVVSASAAIADPFAGTFAAQAEGQVYTLIIQPAGNGNYNGQLNAQGATTAFIGMLNGQDLIGMGSEGGVAFQFVLRPARTNQLQFHFQGAEPLMFTRQDQGHSKNGNHTPAGAATAKNPSSGQTVPREVYINRVKLSDEKIRSYEIQYNTVIPNGRYWYDAKCGAWGKEGEPGAGLIFPGLDLPGPMPADISGGTTGIFINGRELHVQEQLALQQLLGETRPGRYWLDAQGNLGREGQPMLLNLAQKIHQAQSSGTIAHGYDRLYGPRGTLGAGGHYSGRTASGKRVEWFPGMSDRRLKHQITPLEDALGKLLQLQGVEYLWRHADYPHSHFPHQRDVGLIAQEVEQIFPQIVHTDANGFKSVAYYKLVPVLIEAIKAQQQTIEKLKTDLGENKRR